MIAFRVMFMGMVISCGTGYTFTNDDEQTTEIEDTDLKSDEQCLAEEPIEPIERSCPDCPIVDCRNAKFTVYSSCPDGYRPKQYFPEREELSFNDLLDRLYEVNALLNNLITNGIDSVRHELDCERDY